MKIVNVGGTGQIGTKVVALLRAAGHVAGPASPSTGVNTITGEGLAEVMVGASVVVDVSNAPAWEDQAVRAFFVESTRNQLAAEQAAGVGHHVILSIVGTDRVPESGYLRAKDAQEQVLKAGPIPYTIVRATQFHEFVEAIRKGMTSGTTVTAPTALIQPIAAAAVFHAALSKPRNATINIGGPEKFPLDELMRLDLGARNDTGTVVTRTEATYFGAHLEEHSLVTGDDGHLFATRFADWVRQSSASP